MQANAFRLLSLRDERRPPGEERALQVWMAERPNVLRRALLSADAPPGFMAQVENVDRVMLEAFDAGTATGNEEDLAYLTDRSVSALVAAWRPHQDRAPPVHMAGSLAM